MKKNYDSLTMRDNFLFCKILEKREDLCKRMIEVITGREVKEITNLRTEESAKSTLGGKGVRYDVTFQDDEATVYDMEMQTSDTGSLPRRSRYYQSMIDTSCLDSGDPYEDLPKSMVIFICTFDFFGKERHVYTFEPRCIQDASIALDDGTCRIFLNTEGKDEIDSECKDLLEFIAGRAVNGKLANMLQDEVDIAKKNEKWRSEFMQNMAFYMDAVREGKQEGRQEGILEGRQEGILEGRQEAKEETQIEMFLNCVAKGMDEKEAQDLVGMSDELVAKALSQK